MILFIVGDEWRVTTARAADENNFVLSGSMQTNAKFTLDCLF